MSIGELTCLMTRAPPRPLTVPRSQIPHACSRQTLPDISCVHSKGDVLPYFAISKGKVGKVGDDEVKIMRLFRKMAEKVRGRFGARTSDAEFAAEMHEHLSLLTERYIRQGLTPDDAALAARRQFGNTTLLREDRRTMQTFPAIDAIWSDLVYALRMLRKNPEFAAAAILTLALGIGANTAIFSVCHAVLLKPLPYAEPGRIVMLWEHRRGQAPQTVAPANFVDWREQTHSFSEVAAIRSTAGMILAGQDEPARLRGAAVSANFFTLLGVPLTLGRSFLEEEGRPDRNRVVILSNQIWHERFGAQPEIVGRQITLNDAGYTVVGVLPPDFQFASNPADFQKRNQFDLWVPLALDREKLQRGTHPLRVFARLKPGLELAQAQSDLNMVAANLERLYPADNREMGITAISLGEQVTANVRPVLTTLLGAVGLLLLIACANVANLLLSRAASREKEMAVRMALGASRGRLAQQLLTESLLLASLGGLGGILLASATISTISSRLPADLSRASGGTLDTRIFVFTALISLATGILFGLAPLFQARKMNANESLKQNARGTSGGQSRMRSGLVVAQIAIATILLIGAGLMAKSFWTLLNVSPGFRTEQILTARLSLPRSRYPDNRRIAAFQQELLQSLQSAPGVQSAGFATYLPLSGTDNGWAFFIEGRPPLPVGVYNGAKYRPASPGYFETIGIPLLRGRTFTFADTADAPWTVVINQSMARAHWGEQDPVGQRLRFGGKVWRTVIGVVGDVLHESLDGKASAEMYVPFTQAPNVETGPTIAVHTSIDPTAVAANLRSAVSAIDRAVPIDQIETMEQFVSVSVAQPRFRTLMLVVFSLLALVMASIGIYGVMNYLVIQRTQEFGIRMSLGATQRDVLRLVLGRAAVLIGVGLGLGLLGSVVLVRLIAKLLYGITPLDPLTFFAVSILLTLIALAASYIPARRATRVDPMVALRCE
jgi:putative ABC transport system permease protein